LNRKPAWLRTKLPSGENYVKLINILKKRHLHTVCQEAKCPNIGECFSCGKATEMTFLTEGQSILPGL